MYILSVKTCAMWSSDRRQIRQYWAALTCDLRLAMMIVYVCGPPGRARAGSRGLRLPELSPDPGKIYGIFLRLPGTYMYVVGGFAAPPPTPTRFLWPQPWLKRLRISFLAANFCKFSTYSIECNMSQVAWWQNTSPSVYSPRSCLEEFMPGKPASWLAVSWELQNDMFKGCGKDMSVLFHYTVHTCLHSPDKDAINSQWKYVHKNDTWPCIPHLSSTQARTFRVAQSGPHIPSDIVFSDHWRLCTFKGSTTVLMNISFVLWLVLYSKNREREKRKEREKKGGEC